MKFRRFLAYLLLGGCMAVVVFFVIVWILACMAIQDNPWLEADIRTWQDA